MQPVWSTYFILELEKQMKNWLQQSPHTMHYCILCYFASASSFETFFMATPVYEEQLLDYNIFL